MEVLITHPCTRSLQCSRLLPLGYSWLSNKRGVAIDTVASFEIVLPTGEIVTASNTSHVDLFAGLKGGYNNFVSTMSIPCLVFSSLTILVTIGHSHGYYTGSIPYKWSLCRYAPLYSRTLYVRSYSYRVELLATQTLPHFPSFGMPSSTSRTQTRTLTQTSSVSITSKAMGPRSCSLDSSIMLLSFLLGFLTRLQASADKY